MVNGFKVSGTPQIRAEQVLDGYKSTKCLSFSATLDVWDPGVHMTTTASSVLVECPAGKSIVLLDVLATNSGAVLDGVPFSVTLAEEGSDDDIVRLSCNAGGPAVWKGAVKLAQDKDLLVYHGQLNAARIGSLAVQYVTV